jgi:hypothetical protein
MAEEIETIDPVAEATPAGEETSQPSADLTSEELAENPEIQAAFDRVFGNGGSAQKDEGEGEQPTAEDEAQDEPQGSEQPAKPEKPQQPVKPAKQQEAPTSPTLHPALRQAALRAKWTDEQIDQFVGQNPELAEMTFKNLQGAQNDLSSRYAQLGQQRQQQPQPAQRQQPPAAPTATDQPNLEKLLGDLDTFARNNGQELADVFRALKAEVIAPMQQLKAHYEAQIQQAQAAEVNRTFEAFEKDWSNVYGKGKEIEAPQWQARQQVAQLADQIRYGAWQQGIDMTLTEALNRANDLFTRDKVAEQARQQVTKQVQRRSKTLTNRPTQRKSPQTAGEGAQRSDKAAMAAVEAFWADRGVAV